MTFSVQNSDDFKLIFILFYPLDMIAATSVLQQQASEVRQSKINWQSYMQYVFLVV